MTASKVAAGPRKKGRRIRLQVKLVVVLLVLSLIPLMVTALLVGNLGEVAQNFARNHVEELRPHLVEAQDAYRGLISAKKEEYQQVARRLAATPGVDDISLQGIASAENDAALQELLGEHAMLLRVEIHSKAGEVLASASREDKGGFDESSYRELTIRQATGKAGAEFVAVFAADLAPTRNLEALAEALAVSKRVDTLQSSLPSSYRLAFLLLVGGVVLAVTAIAIVFAGRMTRRINSLVHGARAVAKGDLDSRVELGGHDELAELALAFNGMVADLQKERQKILYLQRIGAWQDVARKLAHEIKNPLTPIQLVVQQAVSSYEGDNEKYKKLLNTCDEIVREEIDGLRRLVDAFRDLGRLPKVEASSLSVATVIDDLQSDPALAKILELEGPEEDQAVNADRLLLRRTLVNLIENGAHAGVEMGGEGKVVLRWRFTEDFAEFTIDDEGGGVPEEKRDEIFDPYVTSKDTGTGLGLAIAKKVALDHGGSLRLEHEAAPTGGARFVLEIPLSQDQSPAKTS
jgi:nitrogen fixation/metabolism regulation signal transduction histidine kinase